MKLFYWLFSNYFKPDYIHDFIKDIDVESLKEKGIQLMFFDLDDTLVEHNSNEVSQEIINFFNKLKKLKIYSVIASNNVEERVFDFANKISSLNKHLSFCKKPKKTKIKKFLKTINIKSENIIFIGDRYITDIFVGKRFKFQTCLISGFHPNFINYYKCEKYWLKQSQKIKKC